MTNVLYQHGTLGTLMAGLLEGTATINELLEHGNLGIATLTGSDGEVIFLDGKAYHANEHKEFIELKGDEKVPYASITNFKASKTFSLQQLSQDDVFAQIKNEMLSENLFSAVKIYGTFKHMHVRMMPAQQPPYTRLIDSARRQPEEKRQNIRGAIVGFLHQNYFMAYDLLVFIYILQMMKELMVDMFLTLKWMTLSLRYKTLKHSNNISR